MMPGMNADDTRTWKRPARPGARCVVCGGLCTVEYCIDTVHAEPHDVHGGSILPWVPVHGPCLASYTERVWPRQYGKNNCKTGG